ncbi:hypothetical protein ccbrp13_44170 [Ktedonobacteria bacterium brp13]|nr:hypothetical protein ccbrp13_44170 [Ktedonobacteria bacterium brp13]
MSANKPPFPLYDDQQERTGPPLNHQSSQLFPPQLRMGQGPTTNPYRSVPQNSLAPNPPFNPAPNPAFSEDATQAFQPAPFQQPGAAGFGPTGPFQPGSTTATTAPGAFGPAQFLPGGRFNANATTNPHNQLSPSIGGPTGQFGPTPSGQFGVPGGLSSPQVGRPAGSGQLWPPTGTGTGPTVSAGATGSPTRQLGSTGMLPAQNIPGDYSGDTGMLTLNQAVKVVRVPVPGKPGEFKTGILPVVQQPGSGTLPPPMAAPRPKNKNKVIVFAALILLIVVGSISVLLLHSGGGSSPATTSTLAGSKANSAATATAQAAANVQATAAAVKAASLMLFDPLNYNGHSWPTGQSNASNYFFKGNAYHINPTGPNFGYAFLGSPQLPKNYTYTLTMQSVNYDQNNGSFSFYGMIMDLTNQGGHPSFYIFRVNNGSNISYELDKYDGSNTNPLQQLFPDPNNTPGTGKGNGKELTRPHAPNVFSVTEHNGTFTMSVNNVKIGSVKDTTLTGGELGMCASQAGTDAAFTNLYLYSN